MHRARLVLVALLATGSVAIAAPKGHHSKPSSSPAAPAADGSTAGRTTIPPPSGADDASSGNPAPAQHPEGEYGGVIPGQTPKSDSAKPKPKKPLSKGTLGWIGFEGKSGGAEIFFQSPAAFEVSQHVEGGVLVVDLSGLSRMAANVGRPIDTRFFDSPISKISAKAVGAAKGKNAHGSGIEVRIAFKNAKDAKEGAFRSATEADGLYYAYLSFSGGGGSAGDTTAPAGGSQLNDVEQPK